MIEVKDLSVSYSADFGSLPMVDMNEDKFPHVLDHLNLTIEPGKVYGLIGRNGAGKTTLLNCMCGMLENYIQKAKLKLFLDGRNMNPGNPDIISKFFFVPDTIPDIHVRVSKYAKTLSCLYPNFSMDCFDDCVELFQIKYNDYFDQLSLGQKKMAFLSLAFAANTTYLIFDEPTNGLDITSRKVFRKLIASNMTDDKAIVISTHHINEVSSLLDHVLILDQKHIVFDHSVMETGQALSFMESDDEDKAKDALYSMPSAYGKRMILPNKNGTDSEIDYELLFEAVLENEKAINAQFA